MTSYKMSQTRNGHTNAKRRQFVALIFMLGCYVRKRRPEVNKLSLFKIGNKVFTTCADNKSRHMMNIHTANGSTESAILKSMVHYCRHGHRHRIVSHHQIEQDQWNQEQQQQQFIDGCSRDTTENPTAVMRSKWLIFSCKIEKSIAYKRCVLVCWWLTFYHVYQHHHRNSCVVRHTFSETDVSLDLDSNFSLFGQMFVSPHPQYVLGLTNSLYIMKMCECTLHLFCSLPFVYRQFGICVLLFSISIILIALKLRLIREQEQSQQQQQQKRATKCAHVNLKNHSTKNYGVGHKLNWLVSRLLYCVRSVY